MSRGEKCIAEMSTETLTGSSWSIALFVVQAVDVSESVMRRALPSKRKFLDARGRSMPGWRASLDYGRAYRSLEWQDIPVVPKGIDALSDFSASGSIAGAYGDCFEGYRADLAFDLVTMQWLLVHELRLKMGTERFEFETENPESSHSLYPALRRMFVRSDPFEDDIRDPWVCEAESCARSLIRDTLQRFEVSSKENDIEFPPNCGNMTFFFVPDSRSIMSFKESERCQALLRYGAACDRNASIVPKPIIVDDLCYQFEGRFHTIIAKSSEAIDRYMPLQFHAQYVWAYLRTMRELVYGIENDCMEGSRKRVLTAADNNFEEYVDKVINSMEYASFLHSEVTRSVQSDRLILEYIDKKWSLSDSLGYLERFAKYLAEFLERDYQRTSMLSGKRQDRALLVLSSLQIIALFSVWSDYLGTFEEGIDYRFSDLPLLLFESMENLQLFNVVFPVVLLVISIIVIVSCVFVGRRR